MVRRLVEIVPVVLEKKMKSKSKKFTPTTPTTDDGQTLIKKAEIRFQFNKENDQFKNFNISYIFRLLIVKRDTRQLSFLILIIHDSLLSKSYHHFPRDHAKCVHITFFRIQASFDCFNGQPNSAKNDLNIFLTIINS